MAESPNVVYGRLKEAAHLSGYTFARTTEWLESLLAGDGWREVGPGFTDVNVFLRSIDLSPFNIGDNRPGLVRRIKDLQPESSERAIASAVGASPATIHRDLKPASHEAPEPIRSQPDQGEHDAAASYEAPELESFPGDDLEPEDEPEPAAVPEEPELVTVPPFPDIPEDAEADAPKPAGAHVGKNSGDNEWYTPEQYIKAAVAVMGGIDLDPASSAEANEVVGAAEFYTEDDDGLVQPWAGRVWMNPPYAQPLCEQFCTRLGREVQEGTVTEACVLVNNATETKWIHEVAAVAAAHCWPRGRIKFWHPRKEAVPLQGQIILYIGPHVVDFRREFVRFGYVWTKASDG